MVFTVTSGRSGSGFLAYLFSAVDSVYSAHEPSPRFDTLMHDVQNNKILASNFLYHCKFPYIDNVNLPVYVETSHLFGKGYFEAMLETGARFGLIGLRRNLRATALSFHRIGSIPDRSKIGSGSAFRRRKPNSYTCRHRGDSATIKFAIGISWRWPSDGFPTSRGPVG